MAKLAECSTQPFQPPHGMLRKHRPFRTSRSSFGSGNFNSSTAWPSSRSVTSRQNSAGVTALCRGKGRHQAKAPLNQVRGIPMGWEGIPACSQQPCTSESPWSQVCTPAQATLLLVMAPVEFLLLPGAVPRLHPLTAISPHRLPSAITPLVPSAITGDSTVGH